MIEKIKFVLLSIYDTIDSFFFNIKDLFDKTFRIGIYKIELLWTAKYGCECDTMQNSCPNWNDKCSLHNEKIIDIKTHTSWHNAWEYLFERMEKCPIGMTFEEKEEQVWIK